MCFVLVLALWSEPQKCLCPYQKASDAFLVGKQVLALGCIPRLEWSWPLCAGVYADLDFEALRNLEPLLDGQEVLLAAMSNDMTSSSHPETYEQAIPNAWMASVRNHPFWMFALAEMIKIAGKNNTERCAVGLPDPLGRVTAWTKTLLCLAMCCWLHCCPAFASQ